MSKADLLAELPRLSAAECSEILELFCHLKEAVGPGEIGKALFNEAQAHYEADGLAGTPWREVEARLRRRL